MPLPVIKSIDSKLTLKPTVSADPWFFTNCSINPYRGCQFDCSYCDGKAHFYNIDNFSSLIRSKNNFPKLLAKELLRLGYKRQSGKKQSLLNSFVNTKSPLEFKKPKKFILSVGGGVTDCYQPIEKDNKVMRSIIKVLIDFEIPSFFLTKSSLIARDLDLIGELNDRCYASINFSCAFKDGSDKSIHEPYSSSIAKRFDTLEKFTESNITCGVLAMPILPFIADTDEVLEYLVKRAKETKAKYILTAGLTLKPGNREEFLSKIITHYPELVEKYKRIFPENNTYGIPKVTSHIVNVTAKAHVLCSKYSIYPRVKRYIPEGCNIDNYTFTEKAWYIHYLKKWVLNDCSYSLDNNFKDLATTIDSLPYSIQSLTSDEFSKFIQNYPPYLQSLASDLFENGESKERKRLEELILQT